MEELLAVFVSLFGINMLSLMVTFLIADSGDFIDDYSKTLAFVSVCLTVVLGISVVTIAIYEGAI